MRRILIVGCGPASVNVMKSIHEINQNNEDISKRYEVYATDSNKWHLHFMNRFPEIQGLFHITEKNPKQRAKLYKKICDEYGITFIHIQPDSEVWNMSRFCGWQFEDNILGDRVFLPDHNIIDICQNKWETAKRWSKFWEECHQQNMNFPIWVRAISGAGGYGSCLINNNDEFKAYMDFIKTKIDVPMMFQKYLPGRNLSWESLWCNGELIASQGRERLEYIYPNLSISGITGTPVIARTIKDDQLNKYGTQAVLMIDDKPNGIYSVDLKCNEKNEPVPTEINPGRFFTTSYFYTKAGYNFANILLQLFYGDIVKNVKPYNSCTSDLYWVRHIDSEAQIIDQKSFQNLGSKIEF